MWKETDLETRSMCSLLMKHVFQARKKSRWNRFREPSLQSFCWKPPTPSSSCTPPSTENVTYLVSYWYNTIAQDKTVWYILEKILITSDIMVVSVSRLVVKSRSRSWLCDLSPEPTSVGDGDLRESFLTYKLLCFILGLVLYAYLTWF